MRFHVLASAINNENAESRLCYRAFQPRGGIDCIFTIG